MTDTPTPFRVISDVHTNRWIDGLGTTVPGHEVTAYWAPTRGYVKVFVPDDQYTAQNVETLIMDEGKKRSAVFALGS